MKTSRMMRGVLAAVLSALLMFAQAPAFAIGSGHQPDFGQAAQDVQDALDSQDSPSPYYDDQIIVTFDASVRAEDELEAVAEQVAGAGSDNARAIIPESYESRRGEGLPKAAGEILLDSSQASAGNGGVAVITLPEDLGVEAAIDEAMSLPSVIAAQPNYRYLPLDEIHGTGSVAAMAALPSTRGMLASAAAKNAAAMAQIMVASHLSNDPLAGPGADQQWWLSKVGANAAWDYARSNRSVMVAVVDSGARLNHDDLQGNIDLGLAWDAVLEQPLITSVNKGQTAYGGDSFASGHGTHVCGIISALADNNLLGAGISYNAKLLPIAVFDSNKESNTAILIKALGYLEGLKASGRAPDLHVLNLSMGYYAASPSDLGDPAFHSALQRLESYGVLVVAAAGNKNSSDPLYPSDWPEVVSVVALDRNDERWSFGASTGSDYNDGKDLAAPGVDILSTLSYGTRAMGRLTGTSMSAPVVSGTAALMWAADPSLSVAAAKSALFTTAIDLGAPGKDAYFGYGRVDTAAAVRAIALSPSKPVGNDNPANGKALWEGYHTMASALGASLTVDIQGGSTDPCAPIWSYTINHTPAQVFKFIYNAADDSYSIQNPQSGLFLDVPGADARAGQSIWQYGANGRDAQHWRVTGNADGSVSIRPKLNTGLCLDIQGASTQPGARLQLYADNQTTAQRFYLGEDLRSAVADGIYAISTKLAPGQVLDVAGASPSDGANIQLFSSNSTSAQRFSVSFDEAMGSWAIANIGSGKQIDTAWASKENGANVHQWQFNGSAAQHWDIRRNADGSYSIFAAHSGLAMDAQAGLWGNGTNVWTFEENGTAAQSWILIRVG